MQIDHLRANPQQRLRCQYWLAAAAVSVAMLSGTTPSMAERIDQGDQMIDGTRVHTVIYYERGYATFSNSCGSQRLTQGELQAGAKPTDIIPCPRPQVQIQPTQPNNPAPGPDRREPPSQKPIGADNGTAPGFADPGSPFDQLPVSGRKISSCEDDLPGSLFTNGPIGYWCQQTEIAHLNASHDYAPHKFVGTACGRGDDEMLARHAAASRARELVFELESAMEGRLHADRSRNEIMVPDTADLSCKRF